MVVCQREIWNQKPETICREDTINYSCTCLWNQSVESGVIQVWVICIQEIYWTNKTQGIKPHRLWISWDLLNNEIQSGLQHCDMDFPKDGGWAPIWFIDEVPKYVCLYIYISFTKGYQWNDSQIHNFESPHFDSIRKSLCFSRRLQNLKFASKVRPFWQIGQRGWNANWRLRWLSL